MGDGISSSCFAGPGGALLPGAGLRAPFYPAGSESLLAEATYRFGFHGVTAGAGWPSFCERDYEMTADYFDFGRDLPTRSIRRCAPKTAPASASTRDQVRLAERTSWA